MKPIQQSFSVSFQYQVAFTEGLFSSGNTLLADVMRTDMQCPKAYFVIDRGVISAHPELLSRIDAYAQEHAATFTLCADPLVVPGGETVKNDTKYLQLILNAVEMYGIDRHSFIIAVGGGAVLDTVGMATGIAHRGVRHIRIPTTVLSQNDSGVGVKNGINFLGKKNFLGTFAPPFAVINDFQFLTTLDDRDWHAGIAEAIKVALIKDANFWQFIEQHAAALARREMKPMQQLIHRCAEMHVQHIGGGDPFEMGSSRPLDFGHWAAHKLEPLTDYQLRHGEAVAVGIALDVAYSCLQGRITKETRDRILRLMQRLGLAVYVPHLSSPELLEGLDEFREHLGGQLTIMLLDAIGKGVEVHEMDADLVQQAIAQLKEIQRADIIVNR